MLLWTQIAPLCANFIVMFESPLNLFPSAIKRPKERLFVRLGLAKNIYTVGLLAIIGCWEVLAIGRVNATNSWVKSNLYTNPGWQ